MACWHDAFRRVAVAAACIVAALVWTGARASIWTEVGDAGDLADPQITQGTGPLESIKGALTPQGDPTDVFTFLWKDPGPIQSLAKWDDPAVADPLSFALYDAGMHLVAMADADGGIALADLPSGMYLAAVSVLPPDPGADPAYTIAFATPAQFSVPEPATSALFGAAFANLGFFLRKGPRRSLQ